MIDERIEKYRNVTNLERRFGDRYVIQDDGINNPDRIERVWCQEIPHKTGTIYPCGFNGDLAVWSNSARIMTKLESLGMKRIQGGSESCYRFPVSQFEQVAAIVRPKKRRRLSAEQRTKSIERLKAYQFRPGRPDSKLTSPQVEGLLRAQERSKLENRGNGCGVGS